MPRMPHQGGSLLFDQCVPVAILQPENREKNKWGSCGWQVVPWAGVIQASDWTSARGYMKWHGTEWPYVAQDPKYSAYGALLYF